MIIIEYSDNHPLILKIRDFKNNSRNESLTNDQSINESDKKGPCKSSFQNHTQKYISLNNSLNLSLANDRIGVAKYDFEYLWKITTDKSNNTGIRKSDKLRRQIQNHI